MDNKTFEQDRKEMNKNLIKRTFTSEIKSKKTGVFLGLVITFICLLIAFFAGNFIVEVLEINSRFFRTIVIVTSVVIMTTLADVIKSKISK